jgi:hypothetical protein
MPGPIVSVPTNTPFFDGSGSPDGKEMVRKLGGLNLVWLTFFGRGSGVITYGTHLDRVGGPGVTGVAARGVPDGGFYVETDRYAIYESRFVDGTPAWVLVLGEMTGLLADRPDGTTDFGPNDTGFLYNSTDAADYRWDGSAWVTSDTVKGGGSLVDVGRLTLVAADGTLGESSITDDGTTVTGDEPLRLDNGAAPDDSQFQAQADAEGGIEVLCFSADSCRVGFGLLRQGGDNLAKSTSAAILTKGAGTLSVYGKTGLVIDDPAALNQLIVLDLATGEFKIVLGNLTVTAGDVVVTAGSANLAAGVYKIAGTQVLGARQTGWVVPTGTLSRATFDQSTVTLPQLAQRLAALITDLMNSGPIGT